MCNNGYNLEERRYYNMLGDIAGRILEGTDIVDAAATRGMTAEEFKNALNRDIRKINFPAYLQISQALLTEDEYLSLLGKEFWPAEDTEKEETSQMLNTYIGYVICVVGEENLQKFIESNVRFKNYSVYLKLAKMQGYKKLAP